MERDLTRLISPLPFVGSETIIDHRHLARSRSPLASSTGGGKWVQWAYVLVDCVLVILSFVIAVQMRFGNVISTSSLRVQLPDHYLGVALMYGSLIVLLCHTQGLYRTPRNRSSWDECNAVARAVLAATVLLSAFLYLSELEISRLALTASAVLTAASLAAWRRGKRSIVERRVAAGLGIRNVLIVGAGSVGQEIATYLEQNKQLGLVVKGFLDRNKSDDPRVLGTIEDLPQVARAQFADEVIIATPTMRQRVRRIIFNARLNNLDVKIVPDLYGRSARDAIFEQMGRLPIMSLYREPIPGVGRLVKRAIDIIGSALAMVLLIPVAALISSAIHLDSNGPVLYRAPRVGKKGRLFICYKFRTMVVNADALKDQLRQRNQRHGITFKISDDPRITRAGRFLRRYSLDELPQLWNVLKGEMSLVGPRPPIPGEVREYNLAHLRRLDVTPGLTGLWQVQARRDPSFERNVKLDLDYIEKWTLWLDFKLLLMTVAVMLQGLGE